MSKCKTCFKDSKVHSEKLWLQHQKNESCQFCQKGSREHSEKLWVMHKSTVDNALRKARNKKLWPLKLGFARTRMAIATNTGCDPPYDKELKPIYMACTECGLSLGSKEEDYADMLDGMCLKCFRELTDQTAYWYDIPPATKIRKKGVRIWQYQDPKGKWHKMYGNFI